MRGCKSPHGFGIVYSSALGSSSGDVCARDRSHGDNMLREGLHFFCFF